MSAHYTSLLRQSILDQVLASFLLEGQVVTFYTLQAILFLQQLLNSAIGAQKQPQTIKQWAHVPVRLYLQMWPADGNLLTPHLDDNFQFCHLLIMGFDLVFSLSQPQFLPPVKYIAFPVRKQFFSDKFIKSSFHRIWSGKYHCSGL